ncbi:MAG: putative chemotaxis protein motC [Rhizobium sp.]|nr:putative chemotaxis protein motC [Rhizobium sp.]
MRCVARFCMVLALSVSIAPAGRAAEVSGDPVPPYKMVRTLQNIQDSVIAGNLDDVEMQRYLLDEIDKRLRSADSSIFDDTRNVDAALIYAMSGGNPTTLDLLADRDVAGNFDNRITSILRRYLNGRGGTTLMQLKEVVPEYRNTPIGPYLELIGANALMEKDPVTALRFFDWARLESPGSIVEEAALRRSLSLTSRRGDTAKALPYARRYARRFMNSPYASQFADIFVSLAMDHQKALPPEEITAVLSLVERRRQREIYLRLARRSAISGDKKLADFAANEARRLSEKGDTSQLALAELYSGLVNIPTDGVDDVLDRISTIPDQELSPKDRFLRQAAEIVAQEVVGPPSEESLTQVKLDMVNKEYRDSMSGSEVNSANTTPATKDAPKGYDNQNNGKADTRKQALDVRIGEVKNFVGLGRSKLNDIDALLSAESP